MAIGPGSPSNPFSRTGFACGAARGVKGKYHSVGKTDNLFIEKHFLGGKKKKKKTLQARPRYFYFWLRGKHLRRISRVFDVT